MLLLTRINNTAVMGSQLGPLGWDGGVDGPSPVALSGTVALWVVSRDKIRLLGLGPAIALYKQALCTICNQAMKKN
jgi:hypothetical protein